MRSARARVLPSATGGTENDDFLSACARTWYFRSVRATITRQMMTDAGVQRVQLDSREGHFLCGRPARQTADHLCARVMMRSALGPASLLSGDFRPVVKSRPETGGKQSAKTYKLMRQLNAGQPRAHAKQTALKALHFAQLPCSEGPPLAQSYHNWLATNSSANDLYASLPPTRPSQASVRLNPRALELNWKVGSEQAARTQPLPAR